MEHGLVFKALGDESRRKLLDLLFVKQGRSLNELEEHLPMTRFGVMKHLKVLKAAGLVTTRKEGRETLHYLNAVPIQMVYDRWVSKYSKGWARTLTELKYDLEAIEMAEAKQSEMTKHVLEVYIRTTPERLWQALTDGSLTEKYYYGTRVDSDWTPGATYQYLTPDGTSMLDGRVLEAEPPKRLVTTFNAHWDPRIGEVPESTVAYEITQLGEACKLTLVHSDLVPGHPLTEGVYRGWQEILSGLKTLLETGEPLVITQPRT
ncbi:MAG: metalloregulator ArsR/SmtB family transcription factor [Pyrinomonadaceae bacterium]